MDNKILFNGYWYTPDEAVAKMSLDEVIDKARDLMLWDERGDSLHRINDCINRIEELTRWIPVEERLPTRDDANYQDEVLVCLDPMSAINSPCLETGVEIVDYKKVSPARHLYWKRADPPDEYHNYH